MGSFSCECREGFTGDGVTCGGYYFILNIKNPYFRILLIEVLSLIFHFKFSDIDECTAGSASCHANASCQNQIGSYQCVCNQGILLLYVNL